MNTEKIIDSLSELTCLLGEEEGKKLEKQVFERFVKVHLEKINASLIKKKLIEEPIAHYVEPFETMKGNVNLLSSNVGLIWEFTADMGVDQKLREFEEKFPTLAKQALAIAEKIYASRSFYKKMFKELLAELKDDEAFHNSDLLHYTFKRYYTVADGISTFSFFENKNIIKSWNIMLYKEVEPKLYSAFKEDFKEEILAAWKEQNDKLKQVQIKMLKAYVFKLLGRNEFEVSTDLPNKIYFDMEQKKISIFFDLANEELKKSFEEEIEQWKKRIYQLDSTLHTDEVLKDVRLSQSHYFLFKKEVKVEEDVYHIYHSRGIHKKPILRIFKNGTQLKGRAKRRASQLLCLGKKCATATN